MSGMSAMEKMVANMLGISPQQMSDMLTGFSTLASTLKTQMDAVEANMEKVLENQAAMLAAIERLENVGSDGNDNGRRGNAGRRTRNGNGGQRDGAGSVAGNDAGNPDAI